MLFCDAVRDYLRDSTTEVLVAHTGAEGLALCEKGKIDVVLLDQRLPDVEGHTLCSSILLHNDQTKIIFITAFPSFEGAVKALRAGAHDYLSKPFELEELRLEIDQAFRTLDLEKVEQLQRYRDYKESEDTVLIGASGGLAEVARLMNLATTVDAPVLITGETGTGKNVVARAIHYCSAPRRSAFISINCAALPESLIEAELFGYEKGAFTGAVTGRKGIFEMAEGGTLFLDEIGEMPLHLQAKLLSAIEDKRIKRLGGELIQPVDVRIIAASSVDLEHELGKAFRKELYYRLSVIRIHIPPLRERRQDIPDLCRYLLQTITGREVSLSGGELSRLMEYNWPGNVRELKNILERAVILQKENPQGYSGIRPSELIAKTSPSGTPSHVASLPLDDTIISLQDMEARCIQHALTKCANNYTQTAKALGISLSTLKRKLKEYGLK